MLEFQLIINSGMWKDYFEVSLLCNGDWISIVPSLMQRSSTIVEHMKEYCDSNPLRALAYYYFDFNDNEKQTSSNLLCSLIVQICNKIVYLPTQLKELYQICNNGQHKADMQGLKSVLAECLKGFGDVFIVIDALDECPTTGGRQELLELITEIKAWSSPNLHLLTSSRQEPDIEEALKPLLSGLWIPIQGVHVNSDIKAHIAYQLKTDPRLSQWSNDVKGEIESSLVAGANGM
jgi:hypothetical protein